MGGSTRERQRNDKSITGVYVSNMKIYVGLSQSHHSSVFLFPCQHIYGLLLDSHRDVRCNEALSEGIHFARPNGGVDESICPQRPFHSSTTKVILVLSLILSLSDFVKEGGERKKRNGRLRGRSWCGPCRCRRRFAICSGGICYVCVPNVVGFFAFFFSKPESQLVGRKNYAAFCGRRNMLSDQVRKAWYCHVQGSTERSPLVLFF
jgi:hypothetical protein